MTTPPPGTPDLDLTLAGTAGSINGAVFSTGETQSAGTGAFNAFVQIQRTGTEQGYNTDASAQYDENNSLTHNHSILLADVPIVIGDGANGTVEGIAYREFLLDLNEGNGGTNPYISLDALQIWQNEAGNLTNFTAGSASPAPTPTTSPTISMPASTAGSRSMLACRTAAARATTAS